MEKAITYKTLPSYLEEYDQKILDIVEVVRTNESKLNSITYRCS